MLKRITRILHNHIAFALKTDRKSFSDLVSLQQRITGIEDDVRTIRQEVIVEFIIFFNIIFQLFLQFIITILF